MVIYCFQMWSFIISSVNCVRHLPDPLITKKCVYRSRAIPGVVQGRPPCPHLEVRHRVRHEAESGLQTSKPRLPHSIRCLVPCMVSPCTTTTTTPAQNHCQYQNKATTRGHFKYHSATEQLQLYKNTSQWCLKCFNNPHTQNYKICIKQHKTIYNKWELQNIFVHDSFLVSHKVFR